LLDCTLEINVQQIWVFQEKDQAKDYRKKALLIVAVVLGQLEEIDWSTHQHDVGHLVPVDIEERRRPAECYQVEDSIDQCGGADNCEDWQDLLCKNRDIDEDRLLIPWTRGII